MKKTALHESHIKMGAKMGEFAGYDMPLFYKEGVVKEHEWVREHAGIFDVSHMGQAMVKGDGARDLLERLTPSSYEKLGVDRAKYTVFTNEQGGIIDDLMVTKTGENWFHFVLNAGCKDKDIEWILSHKDEAIEFKYYDDWALIALQGPDSEVVVRDVLDIDLSDLPYMSMWSRDDYKMFISRLGYTGEDGFEISVPNEDAPGLWDKLLSHSEVKPIGLAARDSLRLEMGYALYGHDIDHETTPVEAGLGWVIGKDNIGFIGAEHVLKDRAEGVSRKRVGIKLIGKGVAREGSEIRNENDEKIGVLTSGGFSPSLKESIGQGYIQSDLAETGQEVFVNVRGRNIEAVVADLPFIPAKTKSMKKKAV